MIRNTAFVSQVGASPGLGLTIVLGGILSTLRLSGRKPNNKYFLAIVYLYDPFVV